MPIYTEISFEEKKLLEKAILEARASAVSSQSTAFTLAKLKKSKIAAMVGTATLVREMEKELKKIKQALPQLPEEKPAKPKPAMPRVKKTKTRTKYEQELEAIRERISQLG